MRDEGILARVRTWSVPILLVIIALSITVSLQLRGESGTLPRRLTVVTVALLGVFLALGCLFAFPYAKIWQSRDGGNFELENGVRNILVGIVGGAFTLTTLYIGLESSRSALKSSEAAFREAMTNRLGQAGALIGDENAAVRASGLLALGRLMDDGDLNPAGGLPDPGALHQDPAAAAVDQEEGGGLEAVPRQVGDDDGGDQEADGRLSALRGRLAAQARRRRPGGAVGAG